MQLLKKTIGSYFIFSVILLLAAIPFFYFTLQKIMVASIDEHLMTTKTLVIPRIREAIAHNELQGLNYFEYNIRFEKSESGAREDSLYTAELTDSFSNTILPQRLLSSQIYINRESYRLQIKTSLTDKYALIKRIVGVFMILLLLLLSGLLIINRILSKKIWKPFYSTLHRLHEYRVDKQAVLQLETSSVKEFNDLNKAIEELTKRDFNAYISQKEFAENASHEMQSPLAIFQSKLELLMQTKPINEEQASLIDDLANASKRMARLNKSLILLTKIENNQFLEKEPLSVQEMLQKLIRQYKFQIDQKEIELEVSLVNDITIEGNITLLEILLGNLLSNAIRHNVLKGSIFIILKDQKLIVKNTGKSSSLDQNKLFKRFQKDSLDSGSLGLGLEIVKKISDLNHFEIDYSYTDRLHTFSVRFNS
jgi:signal transduction histidine kinase